MVMGNTHAMSGLSAGVMAAHLLPTPTPAMTCVLAGLTAGAAIAPDLDHPGATASRSLGPISMLASLLIRSLSAAVYDATKTPKDRPNANGHRALSHTWPGALGLGVFFGAIPAAAGLWGAEPGRVATLLVLWLFLVWSLRALPPKHGHITDYVTATALTAAAWGVLQRDYAESTPLLIGFCVAWGCYVHALGDSLTDYGAPLAWPFLIRGQRWYSCGPPKPLRFKAGKKVEKRLVFPASVVLVVLAASTHTDVWTRLGA